MGFNIGGLVGGLVKGFFGGSKLGDALGGLAKDLFSGASTKDIFSNLAKMFLDTSEVKATGSKAGSTGDTVAGMVSAFKSGDGEKIGKTVADLLTK